MYKKFVMVMLTCLCFLLLSVGAINFLIDPYFQYHYPYFGMQPVIDNERYQNPGIAKNFSYDSILIGSSMTQNFKVSEINSLFDCETVKLSFSAIRTGSIDAIFKKAFTTHDIKNVFIGLDMDPLLDEPGNQYFPIPEYLYDDSYLNDTKYLLNKSVLLQESEKSVIKNLTQTVPPIDDAYAWWQDSTFSREQSMKSVTWDLDERAEPVSKPEYIDHAKINLNQNIIPHILDHPETTFYVFYPPYNLLWWNQRMNRGDLDEILALLEYTTNELLACDNVILYGFQNVMPLVSDLDKYKDYNHYSQEVNSEILKWMSDGSYQLYEENAKQYIESIRELVENYDYNLFKLE